MEEPKQSYKVSLNLYDLSQGLAKQLSPSLLNKQIDGIWHTGLVVYSTEYYYGGGICKGVPAQTPYGSPVQQIPLGSTQVDQLQFLQFLQEQNQHFSADKYDLFNNNCNNFTNVCSLFLLGQSIPAFIIDLPQQVLKTPLGQMIKPMIDNFTNQMNQQTLSNNIFNNNNNNNSNNNNSNNSNNNSKPQIHSSNNNKKGVIEVKTVEQWIEVVEQHESVIFDFFSYSCPPCLKMKPIFQQKADNYPSITFCSVDVQQCSQLAQMFEVQSIPTFMVYYKQDLIHTFKGADQAMLNTQIQQLLNKQSPNSIQQQQQQQQQQAKKVFEFKIFDPLQKFNYYYENNKLSMAYSKIKEQLKDNQRSIDLLNKLECNELRTTNDKQELMNTLTQQLLYKKEKRHEMDMIPLLDVIRHQVLDQQSCQAFCQSLQSCSQVLGGMLIDKDINNKNVKLLVTRLLVNLQKYDAQKQLNQLPPIIWEYLIEQLNDREIAKNNQQAQLMLVYNLQVNGYNVPNSLDYLLDILEQVQTSPPNKLDDDTIRLGTCMLALVLMYADNQAKQAIKQAPIQQAIQWVRRGQVNRGDAIADDILIILHDLNQ